MQWTLSQISYWLVAFTNLVLSLSWHIFQARWGLGQRFCGWVGVYVSLLIVFSVPSWVKATGWKALCRHQLNLSARVSCVCIVFSNGELLPVCREQPTESWQQPGCLGTPMDNNSIRRNTQVVLSGKRWSFGALSPHIPPNNSFSLLLPP